MEYNGQKYNEENQNLQREVMKFNKNNNEGFINQPRLVERKLTSLELAKQYLSEMRSQSFR